MSSAMAPEPKTIEFTCTVNSAAQARELDAAWREIVSGRKLPRTSALNYDMDTVMKRAQIALETIETSIRNHPGTGQARRLVCFLAGVYNGEDYPFDLTDLRGLDTELATACLDYLNYDRLGKIEVHKHLSNGARELHTWIKHYDLEPGRR
ncbi:MAG TPA: hypothetical protein VHY19_07265 [Steroidobacteraceae bacterium]|nr:hypothetical protein [Steroidobacteraceae bacterium]